MDNVYKGQPAGGYKLTTRLFLLGIGTAALYVLTGCSSQAAAAAPLPVQQSNPISAAYSTQVPSDVLEALICADDEFKNPEPNPKTWMSVETILKNKEDFILDQKGNPVPYGSIINVVNAAKNNQVLPECNSKDGWVARYIRMINDMWMVNDWYPFDCDKFCPCGATPVPLGTPRPTPHEQYEKPPTEVTEPPLPPLTQEPPVREPGVVPAVPTDDPGAPGEEIRNPGVGQPVENPEPPGAPPVVESPEPPTR